MTKTLRTKNEITSSLPRGVLDRERREDFLSVHVDAVLADIVHLKFLLERAHNPVEGQRL